MRDPVLAEAATVAVAKAILDSASTATARALSGAVVDRVFGDPQERAVAHAVRYALDRLERAHGEVGAKLFDQHFLTHSGAPVLARYLSPGERPRPEELAEEWSAQISHGSRHHDWDEIAAPACDFLVWFEHGLRGQDALRPLLDSWAADATATATARMAALIGGQPRRVLIDPQSMYRDLGVDRFTGREWLLRELAAFLGSQRSGCFVLEGAAGLGKSTLLAWLARERGYTHHFVRLAVGREDQNAALSNLSVQISDEWGIAGPAALRGPDVQPHEFRQLLEQAALERDRLRPGRRIVLVIDGLNEATAPPAGQNVLGLPHSLPDGVYLIVSQQPVHVPLRIEPRYVCTLDARDERNRDDLRRYVRASIKRSPISDAVEDARASAEEVVNALVSKSAGVWIYIEYLLREIERGGRTLETLGELPHGLWQYYADHCRRLRDRDRDRWEGYDVPLLTTLAVTQEPVTLTVLAALAGVCHDARAEDVIDDWLPFLERGVQEKRYVLYHDSLRTFLAGRAPSGLTGGEAAIAGRLARATCAAQDRIVSRYLSEWGGLATDLGQLRDQKRAAIDDGYGLRHIVAHLEASGRHDDLRGLLRAEWPGSPRPENAWHTAQSQAGDHGRYLRDVDRARRAAQTATDEALKKGEPAVSAGDEFGYALLIGSVNSQRLKLGPALLVALLRHRLWTEARAVAESEQIPDPAVRAKALAALAPQLGGERLDRALADTFIASRTITEDWLRASALTALAPHLRGEQRADALREALEAVLVISNDASRAHALIALAPHVEGEARAWALAEALRAAGDHPLTRAVALAAIAGNAAGDQLGTVLAEALSELFKITDESTRVWALEALAPHLTSSFLDQGFAVTRNVTSESARARVLGALARHLEGERCERVLDEAVTAACAEPDNALRAYALTTLVPQLSGDRRNEALTTAHDAAQSVADPRRRAWAFEELMPHLSQELVRQALDEAGMIHDDLAPILGATLGAATGRGLVDALTVARTMADASARAKALAALAPHLAGDLLEEVLVEAVQAARSARDDAWRVWMLVQLLPYIPVEGRHAVLAEALDVACALKEEAPRAWRLTTLAPHLTGEGLDRAVTVARSIGHEPSRARALAALAPQLAPDRRDEVLIEALDAAAAVGEEVLGICDNTLSSAASSGVIARALAVASGIDDEGERAATLAALAPRLTSQGLDEARDVAREIAAAHLRSRALASLAPYFAVGRSDDALEEALVSARAVADCALRVDALVALAPHLRGERLDDALDEAVDAALERPDGFHRAHAVGTLAPYLAGERLSQVLAEALDAVNGVEDGMHRVVLLLQLAPHLSRESLGHAASDAFTAALQTTDEMQRAMALAVLASHLTDAELERAFQESLRMYAPHARILVAGAILAHGGFADTTRLHVWRSILAVASSLGRDAIADAASKLEPDLARLGGSSAIDRALGWLSSVQRWWP